MKRVLVFVEFGPVLAAIAALLLVVRTSGSDHALSAAGGAYFFALPASAIAGYVDDVLKGASLPLRAVLTAVVGAVITCGLGLFLPAWLVPASLVLSFAIVVAACMGACSLLTHDYGGED